MRAGSLWKNFKQLVVSLTSIGSVVTCFWAQIAAGGASCNFRDFLKLMELCAFSSETPTSNTMCHFLFPTKLSHLFPLKKTHRIEKTVRLEEETQCTSKKGTPVMSATGVMRWQNTARRCKKRPVAATKSRKVVTWKLNFFSIQNNIWSPEISRNIHDYL